MPRYKKLSVDWSREILYSLRLCVVLFLQSWTRFLCSESYVGVFGEGTCLAMPKIICAPDSSSLKPGSGATEGVLDLGVLGQPDYIHGPDCWAMKIQDRRLRPVSGWDSPLRGRQAWRFRYVDSLLCNRPDVAQAPPVSI